MRVICINEKWTPSASAEGCPLPSFLEECFVLRIGKPEDLVDPEPANSIWYQLAGYGNLAFHAQHFATLPSSTAEEMAEAEREAILM